MNLQKIPLNTVRQFFIQDVVLADYQDLFTPETPQVTKKVENLCYAKVTLKVTNIHTEPVFHLLLGRLTLLTPHLSPYILLSFCLSFCRSQRCWKKLKEKGSDVRSPQRNLLFAWGWDGHTCSVCTHLRIHATFKFTIFFAFHRWTTVEALRRSTLLASVRSLWTALPTRKTSFTFSDAVSRRRTSKVWRRLNMPQYVDLQYTP